jgi:hypothetical protein
LPYAFIIKKLTQLTQNLEEIPVNSNTRLASMDISNMYTSIRSLKNKIILNTTLELNRIGDKTRHELLNCYDIMRKQNNFFYNSKLFTQNEGLVMGVPSSMLSEIFLHFVE